MALTNKQKRILNLRIAELVRGGVDDDTLDTYRSEVGASDVLAIAEINAYTIKALPEIEAEIAILDARKAELSKRVNLLTS